MGGAKGALNPLMQALPGRLAIARTVKFHAAFRSGFDGSIFGRQIKRICRAVHAMALFGTVKYQEPIFRA